MKRYLAYSCMAAGLLVAGSAAGQTSPDGPAVPRLVRFSGTATDARGIPVAGVAGITFALYAGQTGGAPLWTETQNVQTGPGGHYTVLLGSSKPEGLAELFANERAHWLGVAVDGQAEQPRALLVSAPYALKAGDAETLGGLPPSAFKLAAPSIPAAGPAKTEAVRDVLPDTACAAIISDGAGTANQVAKFTGPCTVEPSAIFESGGKVGIGTTTPAATLDVKGSATIRSTLTMSAKSAATATAGANSNPLDLLAASFASTTSTSISQHFRWQAEAARNDTANPSGTLNLLYAPGSGTPAETGLAVSHKGALTFAAGQSFPGTGTITGVTAGAGLTGGGTSGTVNVGLTSACAGGQVLEWNGSAWNCAALSAGTITGVAAGVGLTGGGSAGNITLANTGVLAVTAGTGITSSGGNAPVLSLNTGFTDGRYLQLAGGTLSSGLNLPANGLTAAANQLVVAGGYAGIGTATPGAPLEVAGSMKISGAGSSLTFPDGTVQTTAGKPAVVVNPLQVALLKWFPAYQSGAVFNVGNSPAGIAFDGANIWIANSGGSTVTKLLAATGTSIGTYTVGSGPEGVAFDGANIWVVNFFSGTVTKLLAATGAIVGTYPVGVDPLNIAFDGANIWVVNQGSNTVTKLLAATGGVVGTYNVGTEPFAIAFDGTSVWVANNGEGSGNTVTKLLAATGQLVGTYTVGNGPAGVVFDGANVWVGNVDDGTVTKLRAATGEVLGTYQLDGSPGYMAFDGANIWVVVVNADFVYKLSAATGAVVGTYSVGPAFSSMGIAFDGANIWVTDSTDGTVIKL